MSSGAREVLGRRNLLTQVGALWLSLIVGGALVFGSRLLLGRALGADGLGVFAATLAAIALIGRIGAFGVHIFWLDVYGDEGDAARRWLRPSIGVVTCVTGIAALLGVAWAFAALPDTSRAVFLWSLPVAAALVLADLLSSQLQIRGTTTRVALAGLVPGVARIVPAALAFAFGWGVLATAKAFGACAVTLAGLTAWALIRAVRAGPPPDHRRNGREVAQRSWPYAISGFLFLIYFQIDILVIEGLRGPQEAGLYASAVAVVSAVHLLPRALYRIYLAPQFHRWAAHDRDRLRVVHERGSRRMLQLGLVAGVAVAAAGPLVIRAGFGTEFDGAVGALLILSLSIPIRFWSASAGLVMSTRSTVRRRLPAQAATAALNVALNIALIPTFGIEGAAVATVISELTLFALLRGPATEFLAPSDA